MRQQRIGHNPFASPAATVRWFGARPGAGLPRLALGYRPAHPRGNRVLQSNKPSPRFDRSHLAPARHAALCRRRRRALDVRAVRAADACAQRTSTQKRTRHRQPAYRTQRQSPDRRVARRQLRVAARSVSTTRERAHQRPAAVAACILLWWHAHEGLICLGPRAGKQQTFALAGRVAARDAAAIARRFACGAGATLFHESRAGDGSRLRVVVGTRCCRSRARARECRSELAAVTVDGQTYWQAAGSQDARAKAGCHLLPAYDEYTVAYQDRSAVLSSEFAARADSGHGIFYPAIVIDGQIAGTWSRAAAENLGCDYLPPFRAARSAAVAGARGCGAALCELPRPARCASFVLRCLAPQPVDERRCRRRRAAMRGMHDVVREARLQRRSRQLNQLAPLRDTGAAMCLRASATPRPHTAASIASVESLNECAAGRLARRTSAARNQSGQPCSPRSEINGRRGMCAAFVTCSMPGSVGAATGNSASSIRKCAVSPGHGPGPCRMPRSGPASSKRASAIDVSKSQVHVRVRGGEAPAVAGSASSTPANAAS